MPLSPKNDMKSLAYNIILALQAFGKSFICSLVRLTFRLVNMINKHRIKVKILTEYSARLLLLYIHFFLINHCFIDTY